MKILWFCNTVFSNEKIRTTASWLQPLAVRLSQCPYIELVNVSYSKKNSNTFFENQIKQYVVSYKGNGISAPESFYNKIQTIINEEKPDLIHIWGTESIWKSLIGKIDPQIKCLVDIQGLLFSYADFYYGNMKTIDVIKSISTKEILMPWRTLWSKHRSFILRGKKEIERLKQVSFISYQSEWVKNQLQFINTKANYFPTKIMLRQSFYECDAWHYHKDRKTPIIFTTASAAIPYKGIDIALKVIRELKTIYPDIELRIAGQMLLGNRMLDGYAKYLQKQIKKLDLKQNVKYLGSIDETQIVDELQNADAAIIPSFVETYCLAFAESMIVGTPTICAYSGAMPEFAIDKKEALFYNPHDYRQAASLLKQVIENGEFAQNISICGRSRRLIDNDPQTVVDTQMGIYKDILENKEQ